MDHLDLVARAGRVLAVLGPNGAGKTSTIETFEGYRRSSAGDVRVLGLDPRRQTSVLVPRIGVMLQRGGVYPTMRPHQALSLFASYYADPEDPNALLAELGLATVADTPWRRLSGGEQQRLSLALALVGKPEVLFLDEPTAGVDPEGRLAVREVIGRCRDGGACVVLTTHELTEAERLADDVLILSKGVAVAAGTLDELVASSGGGVRFGAPPGIDTAALSRALSGATVREERAGRYVVEGASGASVLRTIGSFLDERGLVLEDLQAGRGSLEDTYLAVTRLAAEAEQRA